MPSRLSSLAPAIQLLADALSQLALALRAVDEDEHVESHPQQQQQAPGPQAASSSPRSQPEPEDRPSHFDDFDFFGSRIPPVPIQLLALSRNLNPPSEFRIRRAWEAGYWAGLALQGRISQTPSAPHLGGVRSRLYVVLRSRQGIEPTRTSQHSEFLRIVGNPHDPFNVHHAFPSQAEAETYCSGAGVPYPAPLQA